jgi:hypothetical protein
VEVSASSTPVTDALRQRDAWRAANLGMPLPFVLHSEGDQGSREGSNVVHGEGLSSSADTGDTLHHDKWPSIEESIQLGKGAQRRLMMITQKFSEWYVGASGYHPTT